MVRKQAKFKFNNRAGNISKKNTIQTTRESQENRASSYTQKLTWSNEWHGMQSPLTWRLFSIWWGGSGAAGVVATVLPLLGTISRCSSCSWLLWGLGAGRSRCNWWKSETREGSRMSLAGTNSPPNLLGTAFGPHSCGSPDVRGPSRLVIPQSLAAAMGYCLWWRRCGQVWEASCGMMVIIGWKLQTIRDRVHLS